MAKTTSNLGDTTASSTEYLEEENVEEEISSCSGISRRDCEEWPLFRKGTLWLPEFAVPQSYEKQMNYFNWRLLKERAQLQILLDAQKPRCGKYAMSRGEFIYTLKKPSTFCGVYAMKFSPHSSTVACGYGNGLIEAMNYKTRAVQVVKERRPRSLPISSIVYHPHEDIFFASTLSSVIYGCRRERGKYSYDPVFKEGINEITAMDISSNGSKLASVGRDACVRIYDTESKCLDILYKKFLLDCERIRAQTDDEADLGEGHHGTIFSVCFYKEEPEILATGGNDNNIKIWDLRVPYVPVKTISGPHIMGDTIDMMDGKLVSGQWCPGTDHLQVWDLRSTRLLKTIFTHNSLTGPGHYVHTAKFLKEEGKGDLILVGFNKGLGVISINESAVICKFSDVDNISCADNMKDNICYGGMNGSISLARFHEVFSDPLPSYENILSGKLSLQRYMTDERLISAMPIHDPLAPSEQTEEALEESDGDVIESSGLPTPITDTVSDVIDEQ